MAAVCAEAVGRERREMARFLPSVQVDTDEELADVLYEWLEQRVRWNRKQARACSELLLVSYRDPAFASFSGRWLETCQGLIGRLQPTLSPEATRTIACFLSVEISYWLLLADDPQFRLASGEALRRVTRLAGRTEAPLPVFWLGYSLGLPDARRTVDLNGTKLRIIEATADIILKDGVQAVTHREIAKRSGASLSSLTYHFESLGDLIRNGLQLIFSPGRTAAMPERAVVSYELVLQALRDPFLAPLAATVRRQLGVGLFGECLPSDDVASKALCEVAVMLETALVLAGENGAAAREGLCADC